MKITQYAGYECVELSNESITLLVTKSVGPRIISLKHTDGKNVLAELPNVTAECTNVGTYHFYGGHRLWHAPEDVSRTYMPDDEPVTVTEIEHGIHLSQNIEKFTGIQKSIEVILPGKQPQVTIKHQITNHGLWPIECAAWAITQVKPGGTAILPQSKIWSDKLPNRSLVMWPYADMSSQNIKWLKDRMQVKAEFKDAFKIGFPNPRGWMAYVLDDTLFIKRAPYFSQENYCDFGCSSECYTDDRFIELETLSPMKLINPGESITHVETWELHKGVELPSGETAFEAFSEKFGLE
ncbi:MAG: hypothetical protein JEZ00_19840 [Anaerolineaceae bacterium]|nr:hypothetical protein [Anaerolineaceae bacterium]